METLSCPRTSPHTHILTLLPVYKSDKLGNCRSAHCTPSRIESEKEIPSTSIAPCAAWIPE